MPIAQAALGAHLNYDTLDGDEEELAVAAGTQTGRELRLRGRGVPHVKARGRGDLLRRAAGGHADQAQDGEEELFRAVRRGPG